MTVKHSTAPAKALDLILTSADANAEVDVLILDYRNVKTFTALWLHGLESGKVEFCDGEIDLTDSTKGILLIGNAPPDSVFDTKISALAGINFRSHFTATSWLAAWKVKFPRSKASFAVIDPRPADSATGVAQALRTIFSARDAAGLPLVPGATVLNAPSLEAICQWLKTAKSDSRTLAKDAPHLRELLKSAIWNELTSNGEQHHALSNVLGPVILSGKKIYEKCFESHQPSDKDNDKKQQAAASDRVSLLLRRLLSACGLVSWEDKEPDHRESQPSETGKDVQILLLDDQAAQGWAEWVKECLPGAAGTMKVAVEPTELVDAITEALSDDQRSLFHKDARFRLELPGLGAATHPVLLLDLRLFSGQENAERKFLKNKLLPLVNHYTDKSDLAWPGFSGELPLFQRAKAAVENGTLKPDTDEHREVLTWLPRVVALADMSLPIILFSSTGRRDLVEPFKPYGNIITNFEKPRLNDLASHVQDDPTIDIRASAASALRESVDRASKWLKFRDAGRTALEAHTTNPHKAPEVNGEVMKHFEIYFDESGSTREDGFRVAALVVGYREVEHAYEVAKAMHDDGISWFHDSGDKGKFVYDKDLSRDSQHVSMWSTRFASHLSNLWILPIVLWANPENEAVASDRLNADTLIQSLVEEILEFCLFTLLPSDSSIVVHGARRRIEVPSSFCERDSASPGLRGVDFRWDKIPEDIQLPEEVKRAVSAFQEDFGIAEEHLETKITGGNQKKKTPFKIETTFLSINAAQDYGAILSRSFQTRPWQPVWQGLAKRCKCRFSSLNQGKEASLEKGNRPIHIVADILPGDAAWAPSQVPHFGASQAFLPKNGSPEPIFLRQGAEVSLLLSVGRALDAGDYALALACAVSLRDAFKCHAEVLYAALRSRFANRLSDFKGSHLTGAGSHLDLFPAGKDNNLPTSYVDIRHQHWTRYSLPCPEGIQILNNYCSNRMLVYFGTPPSEWEINVAMWVLQKVVRDEFGENIDRSKVEWLQDIPTKSLLAVVEGSDFGHRPFRRSAADLPSTLRMNPENKPIHLRLSLGRIPNGRLQTGPPIEMIECSRVALGNRHWSEAQIEAVCKSKFKRVYSSHVQNKSKLQALSAWPDDPSWCPDGSGFYILFLEASFVSRLGLVGKVCSCEDFDQFGELRFQRRMWPLSLDASPLRRYQILRYESETAYTSDGASWHSRERDGYFVRKSRACEISVFADTKYAETGDLVNFEEPQRTSFSDDGDFCGEPWCPDLELNPAISTQTFQEQWRVKNFKADSVDARISQYNEAERDWHSHQGFYLRDDGKRIRVFAKVTEVLDRDMMAGFVELWESPLDSEGNLPGTPWSPQRDNEPAGD